MALAAKYFGVTKTREIYQRAIETLPDVGVCDVVACMSMMIRHVTCVYSLQRSNRNWVKLTELVQYLYMDLNSLIRNKSLITGKSGNNLKYWYVMVVVIKLTCSMVMRRHSEIC